MKARYLHTVGGMEIPSPAHAKEFTMASSMTKKMSQASASVLGSDVGLSPPKKGEKFRCQQCGMEIEVTVACQCKEDAHVHFHCCGQEMTQV